MLIFFLSVKSVKSGYLHVIRTETFSKGSLWKGDLFSLCCFDVGFRLK